MFQTHLSDGPPGSERGVGAHLMSSCVLQPEPGAKRRPRNSPEELDRKYAVCRWKERLRARGAQHFTPIRSYLSITTQMTHRRCFQSAAERGGSGERCRNGRKAAAAAGSRNLRLQQTLQLRQNRRGLLRPLLNRSEAFTHRQHSKQTH